MSTESVVITIDKEICTQLSREPPVVVVISGCFQERRLGGGTKDAEWQM